MKKYLFLFALLFLFPHLAAASTCAQGQATQNGGDFDTFGNGTTNSGAAVADTFTPASNCTLSANSITADLKLNNSPVGNAKAAIYSTSAGAPNALLCTSNIFTGVTSSFQNLTTSFSSTCSLTAGVTYAIVLFNTGSASATNYFQYAQGAGTGTWYNDASYVSSFSPVAGHELHVWTLTNSAVAAATFNFWQFMDF